MINLIIYKQITKIQKEILKFISKKNIEFFRLIWYEFIKKKLD
jgi:hypothetical protein